MLVAFHNDLINKLTEQLRIKAVKEVRAIIQDFHQFSRLDDGIVAINGQETLLLPLYSAELFGQLIALEYKNVRINEALLFQLGQHLILTGKFRYLFVEVIDIHTPEHPAVANGLEGSKH